MKSIFQQLENHAQDFGTKPAICMEDQQLTYAALFQTIHEKIKASTIEKGETVALVLPNSIELAIEFLAASAAGANVLILNADWPDQLITKTLNQLKPCAVISHRKEFDKQPDNTTPSTVNTDMKLPFYTGFTSGSTGGPKGFTRSQQSWLESFKADQERFNFQADDIILSPGSLIHSLFFYAVIRGLYLGATVHICPRFRPDKINDLLREECITTLFSTPTQLRAILDHAAQKNLSEVNSLNTILSSGSKFPMKWFFDLKQHAPKSRLYEFYGTSELSYISAREVELDQDPKSVGKPFTPVDVKILNQDLTAVPDGTMGEIYVKSPFLFSGYAQENGHFTMEGCRLYDGYLSVGDLGSLDEDGQLYLSGRRDRMFQSSGRNIYPEEIENTLLSHPAFSHAAVFGLPDAKRETVIAAVLLESEMINPAAIRQYCRDILPAYTAPNQFYLVQDWPYTVSDKTDLKHLETSLQAGKLKLYDR